MRINAHTLAEGALMENGQHESLVPVHRQLGGNLLLGKEVHALQCFRPNYMLHLMYEV